MPIYEYKCGKCGKVFEVLQKTNKRTEKCIHCRGTAKKLVSSRVGLVFKGSGFYINDYKKKKEDTKPKQASESKETKEIKADKPEKAKEKSSKETTGANRQ